MGVHQHSPFGEDILDKQITERFSDDVLCRAAGLYGVQKTDLEKLGGFESYIYRFTDPGGIDCVLRIAHSFRRSEKLIAGEVDWIRYLAANGVKAADALLSSRGKLVESISDGMGGFFLATAFEEVKGKPPWAFGWTDDLFEKYGALIGRMHHHTKHYVPSDPGIIRPLWNSSDLNDDVLSNLPPSLPGASDRYREVIADIEKLPVDPDSFGLIHFDAHGGNLLVDEQGAIHLFDFDDCNRNWFACDIAIVLFYMVTNAKNPEEVARDFLPPFLKGYTGENSLDPVWLAEIPKFLRMREIDLFAVIHRSFNVNELTGWCAEFMEGREKKILEATPYLDIDFSEFSEYLK